MSKKNLKFFLFICILEAHKAYIETEAAQPQPPRIPRIRVRTRAVELNFMDKMEKYSNAAWKIITITTAATTTATIICWVVNRLTKAAEVDKLKEELEGLKKENVKLKGELDGLKKENTELDDECFEHDIARAELEKKNADLKGEFDVLKEQWACLSNTIWMRHSRPPEAELMKKYNL